MNRIRRLLPMLGSIAALIPAARAVDVIKANNTNALNTGASWLDDAGLGDIFPGATDVAVFNNSIAVPLQFASGGDLSWAGIRVTNVGGTVGAATTNVGILDATSATTLTLGASGYRYECGDPGVAHPDKVAPGSRSDLEHHEFQ
jgi:hypothetical protein